MPTGRICRIRVSSLRQRRSVEPIPNAEHRGSIRTHLDGSAHRFPGARCPRWAGSPMTHPVQRYPWVAIDLAPDGLGRPRPSGSDWAGSLMTHPPPWDPKGGVPKGARGQRPGPVPFHKIPGAGVSYVRNAHAPPGGHRPHVQNSQTPPRNRYAYIAR